MPFTDVRFVYFDLDDTLLDHRAAEKAALQDVCTAFDALGAFDLAHVQETYHAHNVPLWKQYAEGAIGKDDLKRLRFERLLQALAVTELDADAVHEHYLTRYARHWTYRPGAADAFAAVARHRPVGIVTNGFSEVQAAKLDQFPELRTRSRAVVISEDVGYMKPHPRLFSHAAAEAGVAPEHILYVGDSYHSDVRGALGAGWQIAWYTDADASEHADVFRFDRWPTLVDALATDPTASGDGV